MAIQEFCKTKSAITCLTVSTTIQPTSGPTAIDDDNEGSSTRTPFNDGLAEVAKHQGTGGRLRRPDRTGPVAYIYDISCKGNHLRPIAKCTRSRGSHPPADAGRAPAASGRVGIPERQN